MLGQHLFSTPSPPSHLQVRKATPPVDEEPPSKKSKFRRVINDSEDDDEDVQDDVIDITGIKITPREGPTIDMLCQVSKSGDCK